MTNPKKDYRDHYKELPGVSLKECPACHQGQMVTIETLDGVTTRPPIQDTS
jgi:hypothetical protein